jgi:hypothetical protein
MGELIARRRFQLLLRVCLRIPLVEWGEAAGNTGFEV